MSRLFLIDEESTFSYSRVLSDINSTTSYYPFFKCKDLYSVFLNLINAIVHCREITLLDSDLSINEITDVSQEVINKPVPVKKTTLGCQNQLISSVLNSTSRITIYTSGTTGQPKKVTHCVKTVVRGVRISDKHKNKKWAFAFNPTHMAGLQVFFQAFVNQNTLINVFNFDQEKIFRFFEKYKITHISATPSFYRLMLPFKKPVMTVEQVTLGGEKSDSNLFDLLFEHFPNAKINNIYASTEAGTLFVAQGDCFSIPKSIKEKIKIVENELYIHSSLLGKSVDFQLKGDYYPSGDLIEWINEQQGIFRFVSRKNELINVGGYKVNPSEVETTINQINGVVLSKVYGISNSLLGNIICADIIKEDTYEAISEIYIRKQLIGKLQEYKIPRKINFVDNFSLTRTGKIKR